MRAKKNVKQKSKVLRWVGIALSVACLITTLALTAFAQNTYVITDGDQVTVHTSFTTDPAKALNEAGVQLDAQDFYTTAAGDGVSEITVQRAMPVTIVNCGKTQQTTSYGETVGALLERLGIPSGEGYQISAPLSAQTYENMNVTVSRIVEATETYTVDIPFETVYREDPSLPEGQQKVLMEGADGQLLRVADVVYQNAGELRRTVTQETVVRMPVKKVVAVGTGEAVKDQMAPIIGDGIIQLPTGEVLTYTHTDTYVATAYTKTDDGCDDYTATGSLVHVGVVAVDPKVVPYGTRMFVVTDDGQYIYGIATAEDCGTGVDGKRLDLYMDTTAECFQFGRRSCTVYFLGDANWR